MGWSPQQAKDAVASLVNELTAGQPALTYSVSQDSNDLVFKHEASGYACRVEGRHMAPLDNSEASLMQTTRKRVQEWLAHVRRWERGA